MGATLLQLWIQKIKSVIKLTWFHPCSKVNITGRKLIERGTWDLRSSSWWKETFNMAFFQIHGQQWETLNKTSLLVNILYCIDNVWDCNSWMGGSETGVVGQRREDSQGQHVYWYRKWKQFWIFNFQMYVTMLSSGREGRTQAGQGQHTDSMISEVKAVLLPKGFSTFRCMYNP